MSTCGEVVVRMLERYGVDTVFGIPGTHTIELYRGLPQTSLRHVTPRHEQGAGFMADGYARVTGRPAACFTVSGPGALNIATAMGQALQDSVPMLVISADNPVNQRGLGQGRLHETRNLQAAMAQCSTWSHTLLRPEELPEVLARAFGIFASERPGPVHLTIPVDVIAAPAGDVCIDPRALPGRPEPDAPAISEAAELLNSAERPVLALGGGCADAASEVLALAEALNAPVTLTHNAKGILPPDHRLLVASSPSSGPIRELYRQADVVLGIGTEFSETDYDFFFDGQFALGGKLVRIDIDAAQLTRNALSQVSILSDAGLAATALLARIDSDRRDSSPQVRQINDALRLSDNPDYQNFLDCFQQALPGAILMADSTLPAYFAAAQYHAPAPRHFASAATGYGTLGYALPAAFGACLAMPEVPVIALLGDGGMQYTLNELAAGVEAGLPVAVVVWNNAGYKMIAREFEAAGMAPVACDIHGPDFVQVARAYGCEAGRATTVAELSAQLQQSRQRTVPTVIEVLEKDFLAQPADSAIEGGHDE